jgi:protein-tyrosine phosphatase
MYNSGFLRWLGIPRRGASPLGDPRVTDDVDWSRVKRLVFLCRGNVCRSPFAESVARQCGVPAVSRGLTTRPGTRVNPIASRVALEMGVDMTEHTSQSYDPAKLQHGDLRLCMEPAHLAEAAAGTDPKDIQLALLGLQLRSSKLPYIADPYGTSDAYHRRCFGVIRTAVQLVCSEWLKHSTEAHVASPSRKPRETRTPGSAPP